MAGFTAAVNDIIKVTMQATMGTKLALMVSYLQCKTIIAGSVNMNEVAATLDTTFATTLKACLNAASQYTQMTAQSVFPLPKSLTGNANISAGAGTGAATAIPSQVAGVVTLQTTLAGRKFRGRKYIMFPGVTDVDTDDTPTNAYQTKIGTFAAPFLLTLNVAGGLGSAGFIFGLWSPKVPGTFTPLNSLRANKKWGTQRRRGNYGAAHR